MERSAQLKTPFLPSPQKHLQGDLVLGLWLPVSGSLEGGESVFALRSLWPQGRKGSFPVQLLPGDVTVERTLLFCLGPAFPEAIPQVRFGEGYEGVTHFWTEGSSAPRQVPFTVLQGEGVEFLGRAADALIAISNYRLHIKFKDSVINVSSCLVLPHPRQNPCLVQGGIAPVLDLIMSPKSWGSLLLLIFCFPALFFWLWVCLSASVLFFLPLFSLSLTLLLTLLRGTVAFWGQVPLTNCVALVKPPN